MLHALQRDRWPIMPTPASTVRSVSQSISQTPIWTGAPYDRVGGKNILLQEQTGRPQSPVRGWREMTPTARNLASPPSTRLFDARQKPNSNHEPAA